jgi:hypothetical protein
MNGFTGLVGRWRESNRGRSATLLASLVVILLLANWSAELARDSDKITALLGPNGNRTYFPY